MKNQPKEVPNNTAEPTPSSSPIESFVQSIWSKPTADTTTEKVSSPIENPSQQQVKVIGDNIKGQFTTPQVMTKPIEQNGGKEQQQKEGVPLAKETPGPQDKPSFPRPPRFNGHEKSVLTKDAPPPMDAEAPSDASLDAALATVEGSEASDTAKAVASAILKGDIGDVQKVLQDLENDPDGETKLKDLAGELHDLFGTRVTPKVGEDGKFGLSFLTQRSSTPVYEFEHQPGDPPRDVVDSSTTLYINSSGASAAIQSVSSQSSFGDSVMNLKDAATEATRLQAIGARAVNNRQMAVKPTDGANGPKPGHPTEHPPTTGSGTGGGIQNQNKPKPPIKIVNYSDDMLEVPPLNW